MYLVMSRLASYTRGDFAVEYRSVNREDCDQYVKDALGTGEWSGSGKREWIVVQILTHIDPPGY